jgi:hypothetical protein
MQSIAGWGFPLFLVVFVFAVDEQYTQQITFPYLCYPSLNLFYYTYIIPVQIAGALNCTLLISTCYALLFR